ncbi:MAG: UbiA family prenyltransferase [Chloroflexales bacterium]|nr:UbiA family prenyltransferase [Chloroflexales bacterium]
MAYRFAERRTVLKGTLAQRVRAHIEIADPVTWISAITVSICGALAAGRGEPGFHLTDMQDLLRVGLAAVLCGPLCTGFSQSINDYCDRDLDAINDPGRPIPSGRLSLRAARVNWMLLGLGTLAIAFSLRRYSPWIPLLSIFGLALAAAYSVPPLKLKQRFWLGAPAVGLGYITMSWLVGHLLFAPMTWLSLVAALINGVLGIGLLWLNDIKSIEGDRRLGLQSMTVALGARRTLIISYLVIGAAEVALLLMALLLGYRWVAAVGVLAMLVPISWQVRLYQEPTHVNFQRYMLVSNPLVLLIQVSSALVVGGYLG